MERIRPIMVQLGIDAWGVCPYERVLPLLEVRAKTRIPDNARAIISILFGYNVGDYPDRNISAYAMVDDYHVVVRQKLDAVAQYLSNSFSKHLFIPFVDSSPVAEVRAAVVAGLGEVGQNGQLLSPIYGSRCFIGELVTDLPLAPSPPNTARVCLQCGRCIAACPTNALSERGFNKERCRSHITQKKGELTAWEREQIRDGAFAWGCDRCTDACPLNETARLTPIAEFYRNIQPRVGEANAGALCGSKAYGWRGENVLLRNLRIISGEDMV